MEKKICSYETLFAVSGNLVEEDSKAIVEKFVNLIKENASDVEVNEWGKRRLAYPINYVTEGYYVLVSFKSEAGFPLELERVFGITEGVLRYMTTTKCEKAAKAPAKKAAPKKTAPKKPEAVEKAVAAAAPAAPAAPAEKVDFFVEYGGVQVAAKEVVKNIKSTIGKDAKEIAVYLKPEESKAYFVADGESGSMDVYFC